MGDNPNMNLGESDADFCRRMGWAVGTFLAGDEGYGDSVIRLTAIGERSILAVDHMSPSGLCYEHEGIWTLSCRNWHVVAGVPYYWGA